jgi:L-proline amide hydrolase
MTTPTAQLISGAYDEAPPACVQPIADAIPDVRWDVLPESGHLPHVEERDDFMTLPVGFLTTVAERVAR